MPTNDIVPFCATDTGTNLLSQAAYLADSQRPIGNQPGVARSQLVNKAIRQATYIANCLAQYLVNVTGDNVIDDATPANVIATMGRAFKKPPTITKLLSGSGTYTPPAHVAWLRVRMVGGGGGGSGSATDGGTGGITSFGTVLLVANGGAANVGGTASLGGEAGIALTGGNGFPNVTSIRGGDGAVSAFGGAGVGGSSTFAGVVPPANSGSGGGGSVTGSANFGLGGGAGGYIDAILPIVAVNYAYTVGAGGGQGFTNLYGTAGAAGIIIIEEHY